MAGKIFVSYRRDDDPAAAALVSDGLARKFGKSAIFLDVDDLPPGLRFDEELARALSACDVFVAIIGANWMDRLRARAAAGERDYVREEIAHALKRKIAIIPVRVGREGKLPPMPAADDLPSEIQEFVLYQKHDILHERFGRDIADLAEAIPVIRRHMRSQEPSGGRRAVSAVAAVLLAGGLGVLAYISARNGLLSWPELPPASLAADTPAIRKCDAAAAAPFDAGRSPGLKGVDFDKIDPVQAIPACEEALLDRQGDARIIFQLARALDKANRDPSRVLALYKSAAERGNAGAMNNLGVLYRSGHGVPQDYTKAREWYEKAAAAGSADAMYNLGVLYENGHGVPRNDAKAQEWKDKAEALGAASKNK